MALGYQLKITIRGSKPPIWRRVIVPEHSAFYDLDDIIEAMFGWTHDHLFEFYIPDWRVRFTGAPIPQEEDNADECIDSWMKEGSVFYYTYDFGDNWEHEIKIEKFVEYEHRYPTVLKSKGPNMIEDCGGIWGFENCREEAEPFDMKAVNAMFAEWNLPIAEPIDEIIDFEDNLDEDWKEEFFDDMEDFFENEDAVRETVGQLETLESVYIQYSKDDLLEIAKESGLSGYSKYKKQKLAEWLTEQLLEEQTMLAHILKAEKDEIELFEDAIAEKGIFMSEEIMKRSFFLSLYGGFLSYYNFYQVPTDVQEVYKKLMTDEIRMQIEDRQIFEEICESSMYLYGVISLVDLWEIYDKYVNAELDTEHQLEEGEHAFTSPYLSKSDFKTKVKEWVKKEGYAFKDGYFMDERLKEQDLYKDVLEMQAEHNRYLPEEKEEFLSFGENGVQEPNEDTVFFLEYLMKEANIDYAHGLLAFYMVQEAIRMNQDDMELLELLTDIGCQIDTQKRFDKAENMLRKISARTRKWDYAGHTLMELNSKIVKFPVERRVYPNDPCPCGSGKKYKHCCGKHK